MRCGHFLIAWWGVLGGIACRLGRLEKTALFFLAFYSIDFSCACAKVIPDHASPNTVPSKAWQAKSYSYIAVDQDLRDVLHEFGGNIGIPVSMSDQVTGTVRARWVGVSAGDFLNRLARTYAIEWYFDGTTLFVSASSETASKFISVHGGDVISLSAALLRSGLADQRFPLRDGPAPETVLISGPPRYLQIVEDTAEALGKRPVVEPQKLDAVSSGGRVILVMRGSSSARVAIP